MFQALFITLDFFWYTPIKIAGLKDCNFIIKRLQHRCFPVNIAKSLRIAFFIEHLWWMLLLFLVIHLGDIFRLPLCLIMANRIADLQFFLSLDVFSFFLFFFFCFFAFISFSRFCRFAVNVSLVSRQFAPRKITPWLGLGLGLGTTFLGGNCLRTCFNI